MNTSDMKEYLCLCLHKVVRLDLKLSPFAHQVSNAMARGGKTLAAHPK